MFGKQSYKCVILGDAAVGKTSLLSSIIYNKVPEDYTPTTLDNHTVIFSTVQGDISLELWDTTGQKCYDTIRPLAYQNADIFLVCFSIASIASFLNAKNKWVPEIQHYCPKAKIIVVGTRTDLRKDALSLYHLNQKGINPISTSEGSAMAKEIGVKYLECSAYIPTQVKNIFGEVIVTLANQP